MKQKTDDTPYTPPQPKIEKESSSYDQIVDATSGTAVLEFKFENKLKVAVFIIDCIYSTSSFDFKFICFHAIYVLLCVNKVRKQKGQFGGGQFAHGI